MPTMRRAPKGMTNRGTPYTGWHRNMVGMFGSGWWKSAAARREVAIFNAARRGPGLNSGLAVGRVGVTFRINASQIDARLRTLPERLALSIQRKAMRSGLKLWQGALMSLFGQHRTDFARPHVADHVAVVSRVYRRGHRRIIWGAVGIRKGQASGKQIERAIKSTIAQGVDPTRKAGTYDRELPGWRLHFLESGAYSRRRRGTLYFQKVMNSLRSPVEAQIASEVRRLVQGAVR